MKTAAFHTLGCKVNTYDTEAMMELFEKAGYKIVEFDTKSDVYVINTCTVTNIGDKKSRQMIRKAKRQNPESVVTVTGCYAQTSPEDLKKIPEVNIIVGNKDRNRIVDLVEEQKSFGKNINIVQNIMDTMEYEELKISKVKDRTRAYIKVQEGCSNFCSYCIIPYARGPVRSRKVENIIAEGKAIADQGYKEIVITGINVSSYGKELKDVTLIDVLKGLNKIEGIERIRLGSLEPLLLDTVFIKELKNIEKLCDHFHLSLQSGSNDILQRMNRKYTKEDYYHIVEKIRYMFPLCSITTDIMVGFPGESEENFIESYEFIKQLGFSKLHVFKYSMRQGTPAANMKEQIPEWVKEERSKKMIHLSSQLEKLYISQFANSRLEVLFEQKLKKEYNTYQGHTKNYILVQAQSEKDIINQTLLIELSDIKKGYIEGNIFNGGKV
ncbi:tRNA (N(6)-L-threonylcarbamoyladenosine(37)-C(2))-methylthiotransferase MtaB [Alkalibaculum sp. M08DMB]|uniref:Threonylcarbamoyladenosine tRNA methylthiotransferase MtaB n=1 Tax=Alkalibaculum sporogenes TaxID=2655001 RepID=A0A6A7KCK9_9FIRM|nr:tRNA (N(6)-L-threonylcarbamoyladenosine(37)-C(2))-methylthiotransferase MtaB [Alkalibaculum sporogenes]MPW27092.1 tRNA (N(6)-L-threonylcarbamoyladenosine(37)-C(2))-methylthiotransferase MtaB [Alkalibaculum sporogenes]